MSWFLTFSKNKIDEAILDLYLDIELSITEIKEKLEIYFKHLIDTQYYKSNSKNKKFYSIKKINYLFKEIEKDYAYAYTLRKDKKHYNFTKTTKALAEKQAIEEYLIEIKSFLNLIYKFVKDLSLINIKDNSFEELNKLFEKKIKNIEDTIEKEERTRHLFNVIKKNDEHIILKIIEKIIKDSETNKKNKIWLIDQKKGNKVLFSQNLSIQEIKYLELVPLLQLKELDKRSLFINELHKDDTLPVFHYNLLINNKNIHVMPKNYKNKIKPFLIAA